MSCGQPAPKPLTDENYACFPTFTEIKHNFARIAEMLDTTPDNLHIVEFYEMPMRHMQTKWADKPLKTEGVYPELPILKTGRLHNKANRPGWGFILYRCYGTENLHYVLYNSIDPRGYPAIYVVCKKGDLYKIFRHGQKLAKFATVREKPVLQDGLLEDIITSSIDFLLNSKKIEKYGVRIKRGILFDGPPGNGKTMACRYIQKICSENDIWWGVVTASEIEGAFKENELDKLFNRFPVTFFDDIDISYLDRKGGDGKMACAILTAMDGMADSQHTVRFFTTNEELNSLDKAFIRPGRIDRRFIFPKPNSHLRKKLVECWHEEIVHGIDIDYLVRNTNDHSFAELEAIKTNLVTNFLFGDKTWNLEKSIQEFKDGCGAFVKKPMKSVGFGSRDGAESTAPVEAPAPLVPAKVPAAKHEIQSQG